MHIMPQETNTETTPDVHNEVLLEWMTPEFMPMHRSKLWYVMAGLFMVGIIGYAVYSESITMAVVFILLAATFMMTSKQKPRMMKVTISKLGIEYNKEFYHYHNINSFWIVYHPAYVRSLYLRIGGKSFKYVKIELNHQNPVEVRELLSKEIPEIEGAEERPIDIITRLLRLQ